MFKDGAQIATQSEKIMLDTGLTYALVPSKDVESLAKALQGYSLNCEAPSKNIGGLGLYTCSKCYKSNFKSLKPI